MNINFYALAQVKACKARLSAQQYKTLRGQILAGDSDGALKGLRSILKRGERERNGNGNKTILLDKA